MLKCFYHPNVDATAGCVRCRHLICESCRVISEGKSYCRHCRDELLIKNNTPGKTTQDDVDIKVLLKKMLTRLVK